MKKLLIGLLALGSIASFANDCDLIYKNDVNIQDDAMSTEAIETLRSMGFNLIVVNEIDSSHNGKLALLNTKATQGASLLWYDGKREFKYHLVKFYHVDEVEYENKSVKMINYVGLNKKLKKVGSCENLIKKLNQKIFKLLDRRTAVLLPKDQVEFGFKIIKL